MDEMVTIEISIPTDLLQRYDSLANYTGRTRECLINEVMAEAISHLEHESRLLRDAEDNGQEK